MLFHATHRHNHHSCVAHDPEGKAKFAQVFQGAEDAGVKLVGVYADPPGHTIYMILETDAAENLVKFFDPIVDMGDTEIRPVVDPLAAIKIFDKED